MRVITLYGALPKSTTGQVLGKQLLRSGTSVGANYREACRARSTADFIAKIGDCLKEWDETGCRLELIVEAKILPAARPASLRDEVEQLIAIFTTIAKKTKRKLTG